MMVPKAAIELAKVSEGFHRVVQRKPVIMAGPYLCPANFWTIGYGRLCPKTHPPIDETTGERFLAEDLQTALSATLRHCPVLATESENKLAAIVDFTFNLGAGRLQTSTLKRRINERDWPEAARELRRWVYGGGKILPGLVIRREAEVDLLLKEDPPLQVYGWLGPVAEPQQKGFWQSLLDSWKGQHTPS